MYRFSLTIEPGSTGEFKVVEREDVYEVIDLDLLQPKDIRTYEDAHLLTGQIREHLIRMVEINTDVDRMQKEVEASQARLAELKDDLQRYREGIRVLGESTEEQSLKSKYVSDLLKGEDAIRSAQELQARLTEQRSRLERVRDDVLRQIRAERERQRREGR